eukprot:CAMPEP_0194394260 /NCGR_PEP_ID=MMETSP0174-20130528/123758_1 /TAXON_ID=216777 /ORGANISM="Proboscia alata, Strain PI-D3" /LENGTH=136 /DNA_ID=CAMNT_0039190043 /DNA_START=228 /DNA_END=637 /DNA_ORIENTATION=+
MEIDIRDTVANGKTKRGDGERRQHDGELYDDDNDNSDLPRAGKKDKDKEKRFLMSDDTGGDIYGLDQDTNRALQYILQAAEQGYSKARHTLGELFFEGTSWLKKNLTDSLRWYKRGAEQGHTKAIQHVATHGPSEK